MLLLNKENISAQYLCEFLFFSKGMMMSEVDLKFPVIQEFTSGPSLLSLAYAYSERNNKIYCDVLEVVLSVHVDERTKAVADKPVEVLKERVWFCVNSSIRKKKMLDKKGIPVQVIEADVTRVLDNKKGVLVFIEGHRPATFFDSFAFVHSVDEKKEIEEYA